MNTIVYLIRHSEKFEPKSLNIYNSSDNCQLINEKKMLSIYGEKKAEILSKEKELEDIDIIFSSSYVRAMQTAKYLIEKKHLLLNIDERFNERNEGDIDFESNTELFCKQYWEKDFKILNCESQAEVNNRMLAAFWEVVNNNKDKKIAIVSHATAITFLLMNWCKLLDVQGNLLRKLEYNGKILINRVYKAPEVFKLTINDTNEIINIENLEFNDLK